ncbi:MAG TPA: carboxylesterase family protein, partial [Candidatus Acidoferrales bacterium]|nr:carboxylesterase family protein [Candidatus Acidoferrales bacterium]
MRRRLVGAMCIVIAAVAGCHRVEKVEHSADPTSQRKTMFGDVVGFADDHDTQAWLGIPFAAPPIEKLRWRAPVQPSSWNNVRQSLNFAPPCVQYASVFGGVKDAPPGTPVGNEDCLYLNIWAPRSAADQVPKGSARLPVMFWIHGGGNTIGEAAFYDGANLAGSQKVIVVTTQYRLGPFGWFR